MKLKATVTIIAEYEIDLNDYGCKNEDILEHEEAELLIDPYILVDLPDVKIKTKVEEII